VGFTRSNRPKKSGIDLRRLGFFRVFQARIRGYQGIMRVDGTWDIQGIFAG
jgi:hypothetical protein